MKNLFQMCLMGLALTSLMLAPAQKVSAVQSAGEPAVVVSLSNVDEQLKDIRYLMEAAGQGGMYGFLVEPQANNFLKGIDRSQPLGALLYFSDDSPEPNWLALIPVKNMDDVLDTLDQNGIEVNESGSDVEMIGPDGSPIFLRKSGGYAAVSDDKEMLDMTPSNPVEALSAVSADFNFGAKLFVQRIPEGLREMAISGIENGYKEQMDNMDDEDLAELQAKNFEMQMEKMRSLINESEELVIGLNIDQAAKCLHLDAKMTGLDGSELARQSGLYGEAEPTRFGGFLSDDAAMTLSATGKVDSTDADQLNKMVEQLRDMANKGMDRDNVSGPQRELAEKILEDVLAVVKQTIEEGTMDMGAMANVDESNANLVAGMVVADPARLEKSVKELVAVAKTELADKAQFNLDMGTHEGVRLHEIVIDVSDEEGATKLLGGDKARIYLGIGDHAMYIGAGNDPLDTLKSAISGDGSKTGEAVPMQYNMRLAPILAKAAQMQDEDLPRQMAEKLAANGRDRISFVMNAIENGLEMRFEVQDGLLELISMAGGMMGGGGADF